MQRTIKRLITAVLVGTALAFSAVSVGQIEQQSAPMVVASDPGHGGGTGGGGG